MSRQFNRKAVKDYDPDSYTTLKAVCGFLTKLVIHNDALLLNIHLSEVDQLARENYVKSWLNSFLTHINGYSRSSSGCYIMALVYLSKISEKTRTLPLQQRVVITSNTVLQYYLTALILANKWYDDLFYLNSFYAKISSLSLKLINSTELTFLSYLGWNLFLEPKEVYTYACTLEKFVGIELNVSKVLRDVCSCSDNGTMVGDRPSSDDISSLIDETSVQARQNENEIDSDERVPSEERVETDDQVNVRELFEIPLFRDQHISLSHIQGDEVSGRDEGSVGIDVPGTPEPPANEAKMVIHSPSLEPEVTKFHPEPGNRSEAPKKAQQSTSLPPVLAQMVPAGTISSTEQRRRDASVVATALLVTPQKESEIRSDSINREKCLSQTPQNAAYFPVLTTKSSTSTSHNPSQTSSPHSLQSVSSPSTAPIEPPLLVYSMTQRQGHNLGLLQRPRTPVAADIPPPSISSSANTERELRVDEEPKLEAINEPGSSRTWKGSQRPKRIITS